MFLYTSSSYLTIIWSYDRLRKKSYDPSSKLWLLRDHIPDRQPDHIYNQLQRPMSCGHNLHYFFLFFLFLEENCKENTHWICWIHFPCGFFNDHIICLTAMDLLKTIIKTVVKLSQVTWLTCLTATMTYEIPGLIVKWRLSVI